jgi:hypothetical protein
LKKKKYDLFSRSNFMLWWGRESDFLGHEDAKFFFTGVAGGEGAAPSDPKSHAWGPVYKWNLKSEKMYFFLMNRLFVKLESYIWCATYDYNALGTLLF